jgi:hypothetical protein
MYFMFMCTKLFVCIIIVMYIWWTCRDVNSFIHPSCIHVGRYARCRARLSLLCVLFQYAINVLNIAYNIILYYNIYLMW